MNRTTIAISAAILAWASFAAIAAAPGGASPGISLRPKLLEIRETRAIIFVKNESKYSVPNDEPGLQLTFKLSLPNNLTLLKLAQPSTLATTDSANRDLTNIKENYSGDKEFVRIVNVWDEPPTKFTFLLASASRDAESFSLQAQFHGTFFAETQSHDLTVTSQWTTLPASITGGLPIKFRAEQGNDSINLHLQPGSAKDLFSTLTLQTSQGQLETNGSMWNDHQATFWFPGTLEDSMTLNMDIRVGLQTMPISINLQDQPLP